MTEEKQMVEVGYSEQLKYFISNQVYQKEGICR
jgi:hypothetical protein